MEKQDVKISWDEDLAAMDDYDYDFLCAPGETF